MATNNPPAYRWPNTRELRAMISLFEKHIEALDNDTCRYRDGWSDITIAQEIGKLVPRPKGEKPLSHSSVGTRRKELYGDLVNSVAKTTDGKRTLQGRMDALEERVRLLEDLLK